MENETYITMQALVLASVSIKGGVQLSVALSLVPVQRQEAQVKFSYIDGNPTSGYAFFNHKKSTPLSTPTST